MNDRELLQQALDSLEWAERRYSYANLDLFNKPIEAIRTRLAQPEMINGLTEEETNETMSVKGLTKPKKEWVGLTDDEIIDIWAVVSIDYDDEINIVELGKAIEAKLKEKNNDR